MGSKVLEVVSCVNFTSKSLRTAINAKISERIFEAFQALKAKLFHEHQVLAHLFMCCFSGEKVFIGGWGVYKWFTLSLTLVLFCGFYVMVRTQLLITHE